MCSDRGSDRGPRIRVVLVFWFVRGPRRSSRGRSGSSRPRLGVERQCGVDEVGFRVGPPAAERGIRIDLVDATSDAAHPTALDLVSHRVGDRLGRGGAVHGVPVVVQEGMERAERQTPVHPQDRPTAGAEPPAPELDRLGVRRRHRKLLSIRRLPAYAVGPAGPECVSGVVEAPEYLDPPVRHRCEIPVELRELHPEQVALGLEVDPVLPGNSLDLPERQVLAVALPLLALRC